MTLLRSAVFNLWFYGATVIYGLGGVVLRLAGRLAPQGWAERLARRWAARVLSGLWPICRIRYEVSGREHLPEGPVLIASMHQSAFDTLVWLLLLDNPVYVLKRELTRIPVFGPMCVAAGMIAVDRSAGASAIRDLLRGAARAAAAGRSIVIFPEGTRVAPGVRAPLHPGVAALAARSAMKLLPVTTDSGRHWGRRAFRKRPGTIHIVIGAPLPAGLPRGALMAALGAAFEAGSAALGMPLPPAGAAAEHVDNSVGHSAGGLPIESRENL